MFKNTFFTEHLREAASVAKNPNLPDGSFIKQNLLIYEHNLRLRLFGGMEKLLPDENVKSDVFGRPKTMLWCKISKV